MSKQEFITDNSKGENSLRHTITINARDYTWNSKFIKFEEVIVQYYGSISSDPNVGYTVSYADGYSPNEEGDLAKGQEIKVKNKMQFHVAHTGRS